eukprot:s2658_g9.t1
MCCKACETGRTIPVSMAVSRHRLQTPFTAGFRMPRIFFTQERSPKICGLGPPSASVSRQPTPTEQSHRTAGAIIVGRRVLTPAGKSGQARGSRLGPPGPPFLV